MYLVYIRILQISNKKTFKLIRFWQKIWTDSTKRNICQGLRLYENVFNIINYHQSSGYVIYSTAHSLEYLKFSKIDNTKFWWGCGDQDPHSSPAWSCDKLLQTLCKCLAFFKCVLYYDLATSLSGIYPILFLKMHLH